MSAASAADCQRLLDTQPLLDCLERLDVDATAANLRDDVTCDLETLAAASVTLAQAGHHRLLATIRRDVNRRLPGAPQPVLDAAQHAAFAAAFADALDPGTRAALALPWALAARLEAETGQAPR